MLELFQLLIMPILYLALLIFILRYARLKPKLSYILGTMLILVSIVLFFALAFIHTDGPEAIGLLAFFFYSLIIVIIGIVLFIGASQKNVNKIP